MSESDDFFGNAKKELEAYLANRILIGQNGTDAKTES
jgi:hypothetical protein